MDLPYIIRRSLTIILLTPGVASVTEAHHRYKILLLLWNRMAHYHMDEASLSTLLLRNYSFLMMLTHMDAKLMANLVHLVLVDVNHKVVVLPEKKGKEEHQHR